MAVAAQPTQSAQFTQLIQSTQKIIFKAQKAPFRVMPQSTQVKKYCAVK